MLMITRRAWGNDASSAAAAAAGNLVTSQPARAPRVRSAAAGRLRQMILMMGLPALAVALGFSYDLWREGLLTPAKPFELHESPLRVSCQQLTVALIPLEPGPVVAQAVLEDTARSRLAAQLAGASGLEALAADLAQLFPFNYEVRPPLSIPDQYWDSTRRQYRIDLVLDWLVKQHSPRDFRSVGLLSQDVYAPEFNFLFGQAKIYGPSCVASSSRMGGKLALGLKSPEERWHAIVRHELGHTLGLQHTSERSVMHYSDTLNGLDQEVTTLSAAEWQRLQALYPVDWQH